MKREKTDDSSQGEEKPGSVKPVPKLCEIEDKMSNQVGTREASEGVDVTEDKIINCSPQAEINNLSGKRDSDDLDDISSKIGQLEINDGTLFERGPHGGKPISHAYPYIANKSIPQSHDYMQPVVQGNYNVSSTIPQGKGRRMDDEEIDQQAYKYYNPGISAMKGPSDLIEQRFQQALPPAVVPSNVNMNYNIPATSYNHAYQTQQQIPNFSLAPGNGYQPPLPSQVFIGGSADKSGGIVTVTSPIKPLDDPGFPMMSEADKFLEDVEKKSDVMTRFAHQQQSNAIFNTTSMNMMGTVSSPPPTALTNIPSPASDFSRDFTGQPFNSTQARRRSDPSDSGMESSEERSPYTEPISSPPSHYMNPSSVDSGFERSPRHDPFSPDNRSQSSMMGGSPPAYPATPSPSATSGYGSPGMPAMSDNDNTQRAQKLSQECCDGSRYIDENLDSLQIALGVIADDMQKTNEEKIRKQLVREMRQAQVREPQNIPTVVTVPQVNPLQGPQTNKQMTPLPHSQTTVVTSPPPPPPVTMVPRMVPPPGAAIMSQGPGAIVPGPASGVPVSQQVIILPSSQPPVTSSPLLLLPMTGHNPVSGPVIIVNNGKQPAPPQKKEPRKILPKLPTSSAVSGSSCNTAVTNSVPQTVSGAKVTTSAGNKASSRQQQNSQAPVQQTKLMNIARRTVADIPRDGLKRSDDEGDTYLHIAVCKTDRYMVQALLERLHREGLMMLIDQENNKRQTPLYLAVAINQPVMVNMFIRFNADVNTLSQNLSSDGQTMEVKAALHVAAAQGSDYQRTLVELLKAPDISINIVNNYGQTALHCAIEAHGKPKTPGESQRDSHGEGRIDSIPIIRILIKHGADASAQDKKSGKTPLMYAIEQKDLDLVEAILQSVEPTKVKNVVKTQAFDGSSCLKIAEGLKDTYNIQVWNKLWNNLQNAASGDTSRMMRKF